MVNSRCHSFEDIPSSRKHDVSRSWSSRSDSSQSSEITKLTECFATINLSLQELQNTSQIQLTYPRPDSRCHTPHQHSHSPAQLKENRTTSLGSPERGRTRVRDSQIGNVSRGNFRSPASPDRFIPKRDYSIDPPSTPFRVSKPPQLLSPRERFLRHRVPGHDPFLPTVRRPPNFPGQASIPTRLCQRPYQRPGLVTSSMFSGRGRTDLLRQVSPASVWGIGGTSAILSDPASVATDGLRNDAGRSTIAPNYVARFLTRRTAADDHKKHESRLAIALDIDPTTRLLGTSILCRETHPSPTSADHERYAPFVWKDNSWKKSEQSSWPSPRAKPEVVPPKPFRILDAPFLRDDFYCSNLAYSSTSGVLAVGLGQYVYLWSEGATVDHPPFGDVHPSNYVTSLSFSSENGGRSILAVGRQSGQLTLWSTFDKKTRFELSHPSSISCVMFKPTTTRRNSERFPGLDVDAEELVVGDELGTIWYYSIEWPVIQNKWSWTGSMTLIAKINAHTQQVCGLAWSPDARYLATGGNDNVCLVFDLHDIIPAPILNRSAYSPVSANSPGPPNGIHFQAFPCISIQTTPGRLRLFNREHFVNRLLPTWAHPPIIRVSATSSVLSNLGNLISGLERTIIIPANSQKYRLPHGAAVKAIAFAPWQPTLLATGGGSNDRAIHFYHCRTGVCLATINVFAQVTSLIWSQTRREIAATFGYAQPEHPFRIAVFAWPSCAQVSVIPWGPYGSSWEGSDRDFNFDCGRALWAISYPGRRSRPASSVNSGVTSPSISVSAPASSSTVPQTPRSRGDNGRSTRDQPVRPKEKEGGMWCTRTIEEGCIIVASSDQTVKFHEIWTGRRTSLGSASGLFGGSDILESMEGIEKAGSEVIR